MLLTPDLEKAAVAEGDVLGGLHAQGGGNVVDPGRLAFELGEVADRRFIHDAVAFAVRPLGAPLFVAEGGVEAHGMEDQGEVVAVGNLSFGLNAMLVCVFAGAHVGQALVGQNAAACVITDAENLRAGAHLAGGRVVEDVRLKAARGLHGEAGGLQAERQGGRVVDAEFDLGFDGHGKQ